MLIWTLFELLAAPFAVPARAVDRAIAGIGRRVAAMLDALDFAQDMAEPLLRSTHKVWHVVAPLFLLVLTGLLVYGDAVLYLLRFSALLDPDNQRGVRAPADLEEAAVAAWVGALGVWGAVAWDLSGAAASALPYNNLSRRARLVLGAVTVVALCVCLASAALFFGWGQLLVEEGARNGDLAVAFTVLYALVTIGALLVAAWSLPVGLVAAAVLLLSLLGCLLGLVFLPLAAVVTVIDRVAALCGAALGLPVTAAYGLLNLLRARLGLAPLPSPGPVAPVAADVSQHFLPSVLRDEFNSASSDEEKIMSDFYRNAFFAGRGALATYCLPLAGPNNLIKAKALFAPDRPHPYLSAGGVLDLSLSRELVARVFAAVGRRSEAFDLLRKHWVAQLLPQLSSIKQFFWLEALPLEQPEWTEALLRELKGLRPGLAISVLSSAPDPDQMPSTGFAPEPVFTRLRDEGVVDAVVYVDPLSPFARRYSAKLQLEALMNTIGGVLTANQLDPAAPSPVEAMRRLGAAGDASLAFASRPVGAGRRKLLAGAMRLRKGYGDVGELVIQADAAAREAALSGDSLTFSDVSVTDAPASFYVANLPMSARDPRSAAVEDQLRPLLSREAPNAVVLVACGSGLRLPGIIGDYVTSVGVFFNFSSGKAGKAESNGHRPDAARGELTRARRSAS